MVIFLFIFSIILKYAPVEHPNRPLKNNDKIKFKLIALIALIVLFLVNIFSDNIVIKNSVPYGALLSGIISLPFISKIK
jgi:accessory gene regulator protein AgrB